MNQERKNFTILLQAKSQISSTHKTSVLQHFTQLPDKPMRGVELSGTILANDRLSMMRQPFDVHTYIDTFYWSSKRSSRRILLLKASCRGEAICRGWAYLQRVGVFAEGGHICATLYSLAIHGFLVIFTCDSIK